MLTTHAHQSIAEASLEAGIDADCADDGLFIQDDSRTASAIYQYAVPFLLSVDLFCSCPLA